MFDATKQEMVPEAYTRAFNAPDTDFHNGSGAATKWCEPPETRVLDIKYVVRNQTDVVEQRNSVKLPKI